MISLLCDGYTGGHPSKIRGISAAQTRGRAADLTVESGHKMCHTTPLSDPLLGKEARHHHLPTTGALRRGKWQDSAKGGYQTSVQPQTLIWIMAIQNTPGERDPNSSAFQGHFVVNLCLSEIKVTW